ncbi:HAAS domain-containing protein [Fictibacillus aquaticus]|nr:DUF1700 domain-containing protein [Fictibacillus aquaticus]
MKKAMFLGKLDSLLQQVPENDRREMLYDFEEHFSNGMAEGKIEEELVAELGSPEMIAKDLLSEYRPTVKPAEYHSKGAGKLNSTIVLAGLFFFNLVFVLGPALGIAGVFVGLWVAAFALLITPLAVIGSLVVNGLDGILLVFFVSLITCSLGILLSVGMLNAGRAAKRAMTRYIRFNSNIVYGKGERAA